MKSAPQFDVPEEFLKPLDDDQNWPKPFMRSPQEGRKGICCISLEQSNRRLVRARGETCARILKGLGLDD